MSSLMNDLVILIERVKEVGLIFVFDESISCFILDSQQIYPCIPWVVIYESYIEHLFPDLFLDLLSHCELSLVVMIFLLTDL